MTRSVDKQAPSVDEAVDVALAELGCGRDDVDVEVLDPGRRGLFSGRRDAHVRVTVKDPAGSAPVGHDETHVNDEDEAGAAADAPSTSPEQEEQRVASDTDTPEVSTDEERPDAGEQVAEEELTPEQRMEMLDEEADLAADFVEGLLDRLDLPGDIEIEVSDEQAFVTLQDVGSGLLIGRRGATLDALQELVRGAIQRQTERRSHVRIDVEGYRARQLEKLRDKCREGIAEVRETGEPVRLEPMDAYERKMMHDLVAKTGGVTSSSEGNEPRRRVVIHPED